MCIICEDNYDINITELDLNKCQTIKEIPILPNLQKLDCYECKNIKEIPNLPNLQRLVCSNTDIKEIPHLSNLQQLICSNTDIKEIPYLSNLQQLICYECKNIKEIPNLPNLQELNCSNTEIKKIPILHNLQILRYDIGYFNDFIGFYPFNNKPIKHFYKTQTLKRKLLNLHRLNKKWKTLWKISEYYTAKKYNTDNLTEDYILSHF